MASEAWVTLATNDSYAVGALVLGHSLQAVHSTKSLVVMVTDQVSNDMKARLSELCILRQVNVMDSGDSTRLAILARPELGITFTKLHCWTLTEFSKCVFLDADTLVVRNCDELFDREELSAAPDAGWPDCFNSGVFVYKPSIETHRQLLALAESCGSFDGGDQGLLNQFFNEWPTKDISRHLPFVYNMTATAVYSYRPAYNQFVADVRIVHFIGSTKPWQVADGSSFQTSVPSEHVDLWWKIYREHVRPCLSANMATPAALSALTSNSVEPTETRIIKEQNDKPGQSVQSETASIEDRRRQQEAWERGEADYKGKDSFDNILEKMKSTMETL